MPAPSWSLADAAAEAMLVVSSTGVDRVCDRRRKASARRRFPRRGGFVARLERIEPARPRLWAAGALLALSVGVVSLLNGFGSPDVQALRPAGLDNSALVSASVASPAPTIASSDRMVDEREAFLACVRHRESRGDYRARNASGAAGAYQFMPVTAQATALHAGRPDLASFSVLTWPPAEQDAMARVLYDWQGRAPWGQRCTPA